MHSHRCPLIALTGGWYTDLLNLPSEHMIGSQHESFLTILKISGVVVNDDTVLPLVDISFVFHGSSPHIPSDCVSGSSLFCSAGCIATATVWCLPC